MRLKIFDKIQGGVPLDFKESPTHHQMNMYQWNLFSILVSFRWTIPLSKTLAVPTCLMGLLQLEPGDKSCCSVWSIFDFCGKYEYTVIKARGTIFLPRIFPSFSKLLHSAIWDERFRDLSRRLYAD